MTKGGIIDVDLDSQEIPDALVEPADLRGEHLLRVWRHGLPVASGWPGSPRFHGFSRTVSAAVAERAIGAALLEAGQRPATFREFAEHAVNDAQDPAGSHLPPLTIAVCTRDRPADLEQCLLSLGLLSYPGAREVLVIDNASTTTQTRELCARLGGCVRYVRENRPGLDWARNRAVDEATGAVIAFTDDDCVVDPGWAERLAVPFGVDPTVQVVTGLVTPLELATDAQVLFEKLGGFGRGYKRRWIRNAAARDSRIVTRYGRTSQFGTGASMAFRTETLRRAGGFDPALDTGTPTLGAGDLEIFFRTLKSGGTLVYEPRAVVLHRHRRTLEELEEQMRSWGTGMTSYIMRSAGMWKDEIPGFAALYIWLMQHWLSGVALTSLGLLAVPGRLLRAEALAGLTSFGVYARSRRIAVDAAASTYLRLIDDQRPEPRRRSRPRQTVVKRIRLDEPVGAIDVSEETATLHLIGMWGRETICTATLDAQGQTVPALQVADALAAAMIRKDDVMTPVNAVVETRLARVLEALPQI